MAASQSSSTFSAMVDSTSLVVLTAVFGVAVRDVPFKDSERDQARLPVGQHANVVSKTSHLTALPKSGLREPRSPMMTSRLCTKQGPGAGHVDVGWPKPTGSGHLRCGPDKAFYSAMQARSIGF